MKIAFIITRADDLGGAQVYVRDISGALQALGHEVAVLCGAGDLLALQLRERGVPFYTIPHLARPILPHADFRALLELRRALRELRPDVVSTHSSKAGLLGRIAARTLASRPW